MKHTVLIALATLLAVLCLPQAAPAEEVWVWIVGGQSNAGGLVDTPDGRTPLADGLNAKYPGIVHSLALHGDGGTSLHPNYSAFGPSWHPSKMDGVNDQNDSSLYRLLSKVETEMSAIAAAGDTPIVKGFFWMQGYQDSKSGGNHPPQPDASDNYDTRLQELIARVRSETGIPDLPVVVGETLVGEDPSYGAADYAPVVQAAQAWVASQDSQVWLAETELWQISDDDTHFTSDGFYKLGTDMVALIPEPMTLSVLAVGGMLLTTRRQKQN
ncbi:MAG: sialate O-acetylesterase [Phycisphaerae bacterium]